MATKDNENGSQCDSARSENDRFRDMTHIYPNEEAQAMRYPEYEDISGPQYVVIRITCDKILECRNTFNKFRTIVHNYGGQIIGVGERVLFLEESLRRWRHNHAVILLWFETQQKLRLWWTSMPDVKQQDWLGDAVDVVFIPARAEANAAPPTGAGCILLSDINFNDPCHIEPPLRPDYGGEVSQRMRDAGILVGLASTAKTDKKRGGWNPNYVTIHDFPSQQKLLDFYNNEEYKEAKQVRQARSSSDIVYFELKKL